jgi:hypothetical protein
MPFILAIASAIEFLPGSTGRRVRVPVLVYRQSSSLIDDAYYQGELFSLEWML